MEEKHIPIPEETDITKPAPKRSEIKKPKPAASKINKEIPQETKIYKEMPSVGNPEDWVKIGDRYIEIKPTKLKYQRARTAVFYRVLDIYPLPDILAMEEGAIDAERDGDKCLFDWLIAATDDPELIKENYDSMDSDVIETILKIFKRVNKINEKEEQIKNRQAKETNH